MASVRPPADSRDDGRMEALLHETWCMGPANATPVPESLVTTDRNRWSDRGDPTIYLAGDPGVAIAEFGRHWTEDAEETRMWSIRLHLDRAVDVRAREIRDRLGIPQHPTWILDRDRCRAIARELRAAGQVDGLIVPSAAFLDDDSRWNAVIFADRLERPLGQVVEIIGPSHVLTAIDHGPG